MCIRQTTHKGSTQDAFVQLVNRVQQTTICNTPPHCAHAIWSDIYLAEDSLWEIFHLGLKRQRRSDPVPTPHTNIPVDTARHIEERLVFRQQSDLQSHEIYVLPDYCINEDFVFIPFSCQTFHTRLSKYSGSALIKHKMLRNGWPVLCVCYILKNNLTPHSKWLVHTRAKCKVLVQCAPLCHSFGQWCILKTRMRMPKSMKQRQALWHVGSSCYIFTKTLQRQLRSPVVTFGPGANPLMIGHIFCTMCESITCPQEA